MSFGRSFRHTFILLRSLKAFILAAHNKDLSCQVKANLINISCFYSMQLCSDFMYRSKNISQYNTITIWCICLNCYYFIISTNKKKSMKLIHDVCLQKHLTSHRKGPKKHRIKLPTTETLNQKQQESEPIRHNTLTPHPGFRPAFLVGSYLVVEV